MTNAINTAGTKRRFYLPDFRYLVLTGEDEETGEGAQGGSVCFSKVSGIEAAMEQEEIMEGGKNDGPHILLCPHKRHAALVLERGVLPSDCWMSRLKPGMRLNTWLLIVLLDEKLQKTGKMFGINDGTVTKWELSGLNAEGNSILVEKLEIVHDGIVYT